MFPISDPITDSPHIRRVASFVKEEAAVQRLKTASRLLADVRGQVARSEEEIARIRRTPLAMTDEVERAQARTNRLSLDLDYLERQASGNRRAIELFGLERALDDTGERERQAREVLGKANAAVRLAPTPAARSVARIRTASAWAGLNDATRASAAARGNLTRARK